MRAVLTPEQAKQFDKTVTQDYDRYRRDVILNPFEERSARWDLFGEIEQPYDVEQLARSLISEGADVSSREWRGYARTFLAAGTLRSMQLRL